MKTIFYIIIFAFSLTGLNAQETISKDTIKIPGVCKMCKDRIEEAAIRSKGVKTAEWNQDSKILSVIYKNTKTNKEQIRKEIARVGHGYNLNHEDSVAYRNLPICCHYNDGVKNH